MTSAYRRPSPGQLLAIACLLLAFAGTVAAAIAFTTPERLASRRILTVATPTSQAAVIGTKPPPPPLGAAAIARARRVARAFLASYLPVLYGRRPARTIVDADAHVRSELTAVARARHAPRRRDPRVIHLTTRAQSASSVVAIAMITDSVGRPYQIALQLTHRHRWVVSQVSNY